MLQSYVMNTSLYSCWLCFTKQEMTMYPGTPSSKLTILVPSCSEKNSIRYNYSAHNFFILSLICLKLLIVSVAFFLGHPVYCMVCIIAARQIKAPALNNCNRLEIKDQNFQYCNKQINNNEHEIQIINIPLLKYYLTMHDFEIEKI